MRKVAILAAAMGLLVPATALANSRSHHRLHATRRLPQVTLVNLEGGRLGGHFQRWVAESLVATGAYRLILNQALDCGAADGCSMGPTGPSTTYLMIGSQYAGPDNVPFETNVTTQHDALWRQDAFYFELGHQFDWHFLTDGDRSYLARAMSLPHWHWWDSEAGLALGEEDGLEAYFATFYDDCAWGNNDRGQWLSLPEPDSPPSAHLRINLCSYVNHVAERAG